MSSSIFEVKDSESDSEQVLEFGLDACEENGIESTQVDGELPKDHTYTKEPDVLQGEGMNDSDNSITQPEEEMGGISSSPVKPKPGRPSRNTKNAEKSKPKKVPVTKKAAAAKKAKAKKDDITEEVDAISESAGNGPATEDVAEETPAEEEAKPAKRGRKRKVEEKESTEDESTAEADDAKEKSPKKKAKEAASKPQNAKKGRVKADASDTVIDTENLPPGWVRKSVTRKSGKSAGQIDVYIFSPDGTKLRSKPDVASYLKRTKSSLKLDDFDFSKKRIPVKSTTEVLKEPSKTGSKKKTAAAKPKAPAKKAKAAAPKKSQKAAAPKKSPKPASPKKTPKLLVKIVSSKPKKSRATKESPAKETKSAVKGKASKGNKKKTNA